MILRLREFEDFPARVRLEAGPELLEPFADEVKSVAHLSVALAIQRADDEFYVQGDVDADVTLECARCLREFGTHLTGRTDFIVNAEGRPPKGERDAIDDEEYIPYHGQDMSVDITDQVREALVLAVDMKPLCEENCKGLCPRCGSNLNDGPCECSTEEIDPRWEGLQGLSEQ